jgi:hypothetical protein
MPYVTDSQVREAARGRYGVLAESELRRSARTSHAQRFDIFLSHAFQDAELIAGVKAMLEGDGLSVYVDWLEDTQLNRSYVTPQTAELLRTRMNNCGYLLYASSQASTHSRWMPWELGYFDGRRPGRVGILPIVSYPGAPFVGLEYLGLYPMFERVMFTQFGSQFGHMTGANTADRLAAMARS